MSSKYHELFRPPSIKQILLSRGVLFAVGILQLLCAIFLIVNCIRISLKQYPIVFLGFLGFELIIVFSGCIGLWIGWALLVRQQKALEGRVGRAIEAGKYTSMRIKPIFGFARVLGLPWRRALSSENRCVWLAYPAKGNEEFEALVVQVGIDFPFLRSWYPIPRSVLDNLNNSAGSNG